MITNLLIFLAVLMVIVIGLTIYLTNKFGTNTSETTSIISEHLFEKPSQLKFEPSWFSDDYVVPYFYHNGWHAILELKRPILDYDNYTLKNMTLRLGNGDFEYEKTKKWATVGDCLEHNKKMKLEYSEKQVKLEQSRIDEKKRKIEAFKRANS